MQHYIAVVKILMMNALLEYSTTKMTDLLKSNGLMGLMSRNCLKYPPSMLVYFSNRLSGLCHPT